MTNETFDQWCILEIMGHRKIGCRVTETTIAGTGMLRVEIPDGDKMVTQFYRPESVYCITPTTEDLARKFASRHFAAPISRYELPSETPESETKAPAAAFHGSYPVHPVYPEDDDDVIDFGEDD